MTAHILAGIVVAVMWAGVITGAVLATIAEHRAKARRDHYQRTVRRTYGGGY